MCISKNKIIGHEKKVLLHNTTQKNLVWCKYCKILTFDVPLGEQPLKNAL